MAARLPTLLVGLVLGAALGVAALSIGPVLLSGLPTGSTTDDPTHDVSVVTGCYAPEAGWVGVVPHAGATTVHVNYSVSTDVRSATGRTQFYERTPGEWVLEVSTDRHATSESRLPRCAHGLGMVVGATATLPAGYESFTLLHDGRVVAEVGPAGSGPVFYAIENPIQPVQSSQSSGLET